MWDAKIVYGYCLYYEIYNYTQITVECGAVMNEDAASTVDLSSSARPSEFRLALSAMKDQWQSMFQMAAMFVVTIALAIWIQPFYDKPELRAFGEAGASQGRYILLELGMIAIFTAGIIALARWKKDWIIKYGILGVLFIALMYSTIPMMNLLLPLEEEPFEFTKEDNMQYEVIYQASDSTDFYSIADAIDDSGNVVGSILAKFSTDDGVFDSNNPGYHVGPGDTNVIWNRPQAYDKNQLVVSESENSLVLCDGSLWTRINSETGVKINEHTAACKFGFTNEYGDWYIDNQDRLHLIGSTSVWNLNNSLGDNNQLHRLSAFDDGKTIVVTSESVLYFSATQDFEEFWSLNHSNDKITSASLGYSPWANKSSKQIDWGTQLMLVLGTESGKVNGYEFDIKTNETPFEQTKMKFNDNDILSGPINGLLLGDYNNGGYNDLFVLDSSFLRMFSGSSMTELFNASFDSNSESIITIGYPSNEDTLSKLIVDDGSWYSEEITEKTKSTSERINVAAGLIGFFLAITLMVLLYKWPEWYVVNTVGICVGSGVVVLLGVSFVPLLIIPFMVLAAIYDAWAVYKSKHMLELADTMINLKLPILLVAPQDKGYSFIEDNPSEMRSNSDDGVKAPPVSGAASGIPAPSHSMKKKGPEKDAMFMGLGDVIFPGMLVISAITWLPGGDGLLGISAPMLVAMGTLFGGLVGYFILMGFVALGRPQAGLPLLNGGSILGYFISAAIFIGSKAFELNITF